MTFGEKLQALRRERGWSQEDLASEIPISRQAVSKWESSAAVPDTENVLRLSDIFGVSTDYLLREELTGDGDLPAVKRREAELREEKDRTVTMIVLVAVLALAFFWQVFGSLVYQNHLIVLLGMTAHIVTIVVFEAMYQRHRGTDGAKQWRRQFYQISVWLSPVGADPGVLGAVPPLPQRHGGVALPLFSVSATVSCSHHVAWKKEAVIRSDGLSGGQLAKVKTKRGGRTQRARPPRFS